MLKGSNDARLIARGVDNEYVYFYQVWQELVHKYTLDVYQYNILNSLSVLVELEDVLNKTLSGLFNTGHNIDCCREEALSILNKDTVLSKHCLPLVNRVKFHLGKKPTGLNNGIIDMITSR